MSKERKFIGIYRGAKFHWVGDGFRVINYFNYGHKFGYDLAWRPTGWGLWIFQGEAAESRVIAGEYQGVKGPATTHSPMNLFDIPLAPGGKAAFSFPERENTALLVMKGEVRINE